MNNIYVDYINFEFEESPNYHDILKNSGSGSQVLLEQVISPSFIYVDIVNLEIPVAERVFIDIVTCTQHSEQYIEEVIEGTPVPEPVVEVVTGGGGGQRIRVMGGRPWSEEDFYNYSQNTAVIEEYIGIAEEITVVAKISNGMETKVRKPIYAQPIYDVRSYEPVEDIPVAIISQTSRFASRSIKDEEELMLLGII